MDFCNFFQLSYYDFSLLNDTAHPVYDLYDNKIIFQSSKTANDFQTI